MKSAMALMTTMEAAAIEFPGLREAFANLYSKSV